METEVKKRRGHRQPSGIEWKHTTITMRPKQWQAFQKAVAITNKSPSRFAIDLALKYDGIPPESDYGKEEKTKVYPLCFSKEELDELQRKCEEIEMKKSKYLTNIIMEHLGL